MKNCTCNCYVISWKERSVPSPDSLAIWNKWCSLTPEVKMSSTCLEACSSALCTHCNALFAGLCTFCAFYVYYCTPTEKQTSTWPKTYSFALCTHILELFGLCTFCAFHILLHTNRQTNKHLTKSLFICTVYTHSRIVWSLHILCISYSIAHQQTNKQTNNCLPRLRSEAQWTHIFVFGACVHSICTPKSWPPFQTKKEFWTHKTCI